MRWMLLVVLGWPLMAQSNIPPWSILQGELLEWDVTRAGDGELSVRESSSEVNRCRVTADTYLTRQSIRITHTAVKAGDTVQVVADMRRGLSQCMALTIYVFPPDPARRGLARGSAPLSLPSLPRGGTTDYNWTRGNLTFSGIVQSLDPDRMLLKTREGERIVRLRADTVYSTGGKVVDKKSLPMQTQVFVRGGRALGGDVEAYQIIWGDILTPGRQ